MYVYLSKHHSEMTLICIRSPSPDRRKSNNGKLKSRNTMRRKAKLENYDADLSMDSLNSVVPLRIDKNGKINIEDRAEKKMRSDGTSCNAKRSNNDSNVWCGQEILSKLSSLRSVSYKQIISAIITQYFFSIMKFIIIKLLKIIN